ncbi:MAG TPA: hypothetical protein VG986_14735 [Pseudolabrys sp.]|nr:hypothetical protein [Pseudolabrys sp.]
MDPKLVGKVARWLFTAYSKETKGEAVKWIEASPETRKLWMKLARVALKAGAGPEDAATAEL